MPVEAAEVRRRNLGYCFFLNNIMIYYSKKQYIAVSNDYKIKSKKKRANLRGLQTLLLP
jgi:hypothetical protein